MIYFEIDNKETAESLSRICFKLFSKVNDQYDTDRLFQYCPNPHNEKVLAFFNESAIVARAFRHDLEQVLDELGILMGNKLPKQEAQQIAYYIVNNSNIIISNIIPDYYKQNSITKSDAEKLGYFQLPFGESEK